MDAIFEDFVFPNISNNQSFGEHGGHLWAEGERQGGLEDHFQEKSILRINHNNFWGDGAVYTACVMTLHRFFLQMQQLEKAL